MEYKLYCGAFNKSPKCLVTTSFDELQGNVFSDFHTSKISTTDIVSLYNTTNRIFDDVNIAVFTTARLDGQNMVVLSGENVLGIVDPKMFLGRVGTLKRLSMDLKCLPEKKYAGAGEDVEKNIKEISQYILDRHNLHLTAIDESTFVPGLSFLRKHPIEIREIPDENDMYPEYIPFLKYVYDVLSGRITVDGNEWSQYSNMVKIVYEGFKHNIVNKYRTDARMMVEGHGSYGKH